MSHPPPPLPSPSDSEESASIYGSSVGSVAGSTKNSTRQPEMPEPAPTKAKPSIVVPPPGNLIFGLISRFI